jgi:H+/Cl- antiporter ClcA
MRVGTMPRSEVSKWWKINYHYFALAVLFAGSLFATLGVLALNYTDKIAPSGLDFVTSIGAWGYWFFVLGILGAVAGGYFTYSYVSTLRKFERLMSMKGRSNFIRDLDEIERLAYVLGPSFEKRVVEKKSEMKIKF